MPTNEILQLASDVQPTPGPKVRVPGKGGKEPSVTAVTQDVNVHARHGLGLRGGFRDELGNSVPVLSIRNLVRGTPA